MLTSVRGSTPSNSLTSPSLLAGLCTYKDFLGDYGQSAKCHPHIDLNGNLFQEGLSQQLLWYITLWSELHLIQVSAKHYWSKMFSYHCLPDVCTWMFIVNSCCIFRKWSEYAMIMILMVIIITTNVIFYFHSTWLLLTLDGRSCRCFRLRSPVSSDPIIKQEGT